MSRNFTSTSPLHHAISPIFLKDMVFTMMACFVHQWPNSRSLAATDTSFGAFESNHKDRMMIERAKTARFSTKLLTGRLFRGVAGSAALLFGLSTNANALVVGTPTPYTGNCFPFGCTYWTPPYQQIWDASAFSGPLTIWSLTFYNTQQDSGNYETNHGTYTIELSTTSKSVDGLSSTPSDNLGSDNTTVFSGSIYTDMGAFGGSFDIIFDTPFYYDPTQGNLLMQVTAVNLSSTGFTYFDMSTAAGDTQSRLYNGFFTDTWALITGFNEAQAQVPEPGTLLLLGGGLLGLGFSRRNRRAAA